MNERLKWTIVLIIAVSSLVLYGLYNQNVILNEKMEIDTLDQRVNDYVDRINPDLEVADVFIYSDADYYFSIEEASTGKGAMELLVDPYRGTIRPEPGPNMMWNQKYGMHSGGYGMMGTAPYNNNDYPSATLITREQALIEANNYVQSSLNPDYYVPDEGHEFYGYYTFHIEENGTTVGMLSVNEYTAEVWYHDWHGTLLDVKSHHHE